MLHSEYTRLVPASRFYAAVHGTLPDLKDVTVVRRLVDLLAASCPDHSPTGTWAAAVKWTGHAHPALLTASSWDDRQKER